MTDEDVVHLINKDIDGEILPDETRRLKDQLATDPLARELRDELHTTVRFLDTVREVDPPPTLKSSVFGAIRAKEEAELRNPGRVRFYSSVWETIRRQLTPGLAYAFAGGLATGMLVLVLIFKALQAPPFDESQAEGTMALTTERASVNLDGVHGTIVVDHFDGAKSLNLNLSALQNLSVRIGFDPRAVHVYNVKPPANPASQVAIRNGEIEIQGNGKVECSIAFQTLGEPATRLHVSLSSAGRTIYEKDMVVDASPR